MIYTSLGTKCQIVMVPGMHVGEEWPRQVLVEFLERPNVRRLYNPSELKADNGILEIVEAIEKARQSYPTLTPDNYLDRMVGKCPRCKKVIEVDQEGCLIEHSIMRSQLKMKKSHKYPVKCDGSGWLPSGNPMTFREWSQKKHGQSVS